MILARSMLTLEQHWWHEPAVALRLARCRTKGRDLPKSGIDCPSASLYQASYLHAVCLVVPLCEPGNRQAISQTSHAAVLTVCFAQAIEAELTQGAAMSFLDHLPIELLARLLAQTASDDKHLRDVTPYILPHVVGQLMLVCKRFAETVQTAAFWQQSWVHLETTSSLHDPRHAAWVTRLAVNVTAPSSKRPPYSLFLCAICCRPPAC